MRAYYADLVKALLLCAPEIEEERLLWPENARAGLGISGLETRYHVGMKTATATGRDGVRQAGLGAAHHSILIDLAVAVSIAALEHVRDALRRPLVLRLRPGLGCGAYSPTQGRGYVTLREVSLALPIPRDESALCLQFNLFESRPLGRRLCCSMRLAAGDRFLGLFSASKHFLQPTRESERAGSQDDC
jgi:hypothetical protein